MLLNVVRHYHWSFKLLYCKYMLYKNGIKSIYCIFNSSYAFEFVYMLLKVVRHYHGSIKAVSCEYQGSIKGT